MEIKEDMCHDYYRTKTEYDAQLRWGWCRTIKSLQAIQNNVILD